MRVAIRYQTKSLAICCGCRVNPKNWVLIVPSAPQWS